MAINVFLGANDTFTAANNNLTVKGAAGGSEKLLIATGVTGVTTDANIERIELAGALSTYKFSVGTSGIVITDLAGTVVATIPSLNQAATVAFTDGSATLTQTGATAATLGAVALTSTAAVVAPTLNTADKSTVTGSTGGAVTGQSFALTNNATADTFALTSGNDTVTGTTATMVAADAIIDATTTDADTATFSVTAAAPALTVSKVETVSYNGQFATTGADLSNVSGAKVVNFDSTITGGTATVTLAQSGAGKIALGSGIGTFTTTTAATGTNGTVTVDSGTATTAATITGSGVNDTYVFNNPAAASALTLTGGVGAGDNFTVNFTKGGTVTLTTATLENLTLNSATVANTANIGANGAATLVNGANAGTTGPKAVVAATTDFTLRADLDALQGIRIEKSGSGVFTVRADADTTAGATLNGIAANVLDVRAALGAAAYTVNEATTIKLNAANVVDAANLFNINNLEGTLAVAGSLGLDITNGQAAKIGFGANVATVNITANTAALTAASAGAITDLDISTGAVTTATLTGDKAVTITTLNVSANDVFSASALTGNLTIGATTAATAATVQGGSGNDTITLGTGGGLLVTNAGNDTVTSLTGNTTVYGGDGTDSITTGAGADSIDGGAGVDNIVTAAGNDTILGGAGVDTINGGTGTDTLTGGTDGDVFVFAAAATANETGGVPAAGVSDVITDWTAGDKIDSGTVLTINATAAAAVAATANISATGLATFAAADNTLALKLVAVGNALAAGTGNAGEVAVFVDAGDTYLYIYDGVAAAGANTDHLVRLVGVNATTGITIDAAGDITAIA